MRKARSIFLGSILAALACADLPSQKEATTILSLLGKCEIAGVMRLERFVVLPNKAPGAEFSCIKPVKGAVPWQTVIIERRPALCMSPDIAGIRPGQDVFLFIKGGRILPRGIIYEAKESYEPVKALYKAKSDKETCKILALQLYHKNIRISRDALLSLFAMNDNTLYATRGTVSKALYHFIDKECKNPSPVFPWAMELASRLSLRETVPWIARFTLSTRKNKSLIPCAARTLKKLGPGEAVRIFSRAEAGEENTAENIVCALSIIKTRDSEPLLEKLAGFKALRIRKMAVSALARINPRNRFLLRLLEKGDEMGVHAARALLETGRDNIRKLIIRASSLNPKLKKALHSVEKRKPRFKALFK